MMGIWYRLDKQISRAERVLVSVSLIVMILVAFTQILLRNFFSAGIDWGDSLVRYLVVWVAFIGAAVATREGKHITIDILSRGLTGRAKIAIQAVCYFFSLTICALLTLAAVKFIGFEVQMGTTVFFKMPAWIPELIIPVTFALMTLRYTFRFVNEITRIVNRDPVNENEQHV